MVSPEKVFKVGACRASIFINEVVKEGKRITIPKVVFQIRYRDKDGQWQKWWEESKDKLHYDPMRRRLVQ